MHRGDAPATWLVAALGLPSSAQQLPVPHAVVILPLRAFSAASCVVAMATAAWPGGCACVRVCMCTRQCVFVCARSCSYNTLDLNSSPHPRRSGRRTWLERLTCFLVKKLRFVNTMLSFTHTHARWAAPWFLPVHQRRRGKLSFNCVFEWMQMKTFLNSISAEYVFSFSSKNLMNILEAETRWWQIGEKMGCENVCYLWQMSHFDLSARKREAWWVLLPSLCRTNNMEKMQVCAYVGSINGLHDW